MHAPQNVTALVEELVAQAINHETSDPFRDLSESLLVKSSSLSDIVDKILFAAAAPFCPPYVFVNLVKPFIEASDNRAAELAAKVSFSCCRIGERQPARELAVAATAVLIAQAADLS